MSAKSTQRTYPSEYLRCDKCGNADRFLEVMEYESHIIDGNLNYLHLAYAETDRYECFYCGEEVHVRERKQRPSSRIKGC